MKPKQCFLNILSACLMCLLMQNSWAQDEVRMKVQSDVMRRIVLAVSTFSSDRQTDLATNLRQMIINDLTLSGFFRIVDLSLYQDPASTGASSESLSRDRIGGASVRLDGDLVLRGNDVTFNAKLVELASGLTILQKTFTGRFETLRPLAHRTADAVTAYLAGDEGIASTRIVFVRTEGDAKEISTVDYDGFNARQLTRSGVLNLSPSWSPDGRKLAFTSYEKGNPDLVILDLECGRKIHFSQGSELHSAPDWSPDGKRIAMTMTRDGNADIYILDMERQTLRRLTHGSAIDVSPSWSPNGREIAFTSNRSGRPQIYIMESDGSNVRRLTYEGAYNASPSWSPVGDRIAYVSRIEGRFQIFTIDVNGERPRQLTDSSGNNENPTWSPNGMWIALASSRSGRWDIYVIRRDGADLRRVTTTGTNVAPNWSPRLSYE